VTPGFAVSEAPAIASADREAAAKSALRSDRRSPAHCPSGAEIPGHGYSSPSKNSYSRGKEEAGGRSSIRLFESDKHANAASSPSGLSSDFRADFLDFE
jgi:hypothetical protein